MKSEKDLVEQNLVPGTTKSSSGNENFNYLFMQAPVAVCLLSGPQYKVEMVNDSMLEFLGRSTDVIGKPLESSLTEAKKQGLIDLLEKVRETQQPLYVSKFPATIDFNGVLETRYFSLIFKPYFLNPGDQRSDSIFCVAHNITDEVLSL